MMPFMLCIVYNYLYIVYMCTLLSMYLKNYNSHLKKISKI